VIKILENLEDLKKEITSIKEGIDLNQILSIELPFIDSQSDFTIINLPSYDSENSMHLIFVSGKEIFAYFPSKIQKIEKKFEKLTSKKNGESTTIIFTLLKSVLKRYSREFLKIRESMNKLEMNPVLESIEETGRELRKLTDRMEGLFQIVIELKEEEIECFNVSLLELDYELFNTETRYWLERCRSHNYRIASLRTKSEMRSNQELNDTMKKLTVIMTLLTIVSIVVNVPGTIGAIFGIPALSTAYFESYTTLLVIILIITTGLSILFGYLYWKSLNLKMP